MTIATHQANSEGCFAAPVIALLGTSKIARSSSKEQQSISGTTSEIQYRKTLPGEFVPG